MSRFVSAGTSAENAAEKDAEWMRVQKELEANRERKFEPGTQEGGKSLYEVLQANKAAKQDAFEESIKLKNQFRSLDDDEIEFLDSVLESTRAREAAVQKETSEELEHFRKQQEEAGKAIAAQGEDGSPEVLEEQWTTKGKKRRRSHVKESLVGLKLRKTSSAGGDPRPKGIAKEPPKEDSPSSIAKDEAISRNPITAISPSKPPSEEMPKPSPSPPAAGLGLGAYSSEDED